MRHSQGGSVQYGTHIKHYYIFKFTIYMDDFYMEWQHIICAFEFAVFLEATVINSSFVTITLFLSVRSLTCVHPTVCSRFNPLRPSGNYMNHLL
jgi:hypothetical protein